MLRTGNTLEWRTRRALIALVMWLFGTLVLVPLCLQWSRGHTWLPTPMHDSITLVALVIVSPLLAHVVLHGVEKSQPGAGWNIFVGILNMLTGAGLILISANVKLAGMPVAYSPWWIFGAGAAFLILGLLHMPGKDVTRS